LKKEFLDPRDEMKRISRRSFIWAGAAILGAYGGFKFLANRRDDEFLPPALRRGLDVNEGVWMKAFSSGKGAPTFSPSERTLARVNDIGLAKGFDPATWSLSVENIGGGRLVLSLDDIEALPRHEFTTQFCCIEGWSYIVIWAGARFSDFAAKYLTGKAPYVYMETPERDYYVGLDIDSMMHPQTLLCYEMNDAPLTLPHGGPLRLVIPVKYGIKNIKRIGRIQFTDKKPGDYWAERGYDWYAGL
jgi:DMSO/TMAO reductase YedYZ molybdopterin-dependent catalytic subunit